MRDPEVTKQYCNEMCDVSPRHNPTTYCPLWCSFHYDSLHTPQVCKNPNKARSRKLRLSSQEEVDAHPWLPGNRVQFDDAGTNADRASPAPGNALRKLPPGGSFSDSNSTATPRPQAPRTSSKRAGGLDRSDRDFSGTGQAKKVKTAPPPVPVPICE